MKKGLYPGVVIMAAGLLYIAVPLFLLPVCEHTPGMMAMKCFWTARAELGLGALIIFGGLLSCFSSAERRIGLSLMVAATALLGAALPLFVIGVCPGPAMPCRAGTLPALLLLSGALFLFSIFNCYRLHKSKKSTSHA